ncbi:MAG: diguanylate cyclase [Proteobacteria bacterium]|nr:diguanylate cyclase [Pseudomonadota bacterium]
MRTTAIFLTLLTSLVLFSGASWAAKAEIPRLTLADMEETYSLKGSWQFLPGDDFSWAVAAYDDSGWQEKRIPQRWARGGYPEYGQLAWYRLTLRFDPSQREELSHLGVRMGKVLNAYQLYAGGELIGEVGKMPPLSEVNYDRKRVFAIPPSAIAVDGTLVLALRVWGGSDLALSKWGGGPHEGEFRIGNYAKLLQASFLSEIPGLMACVLFLGFGCYHIYLYRRNPQLQTYLWYGLMALDIGIYSLMSNQWRYRLDWSFITYEKIEFGAIYLFPALVIQMMWSLLDLPIGRLLRVYQFSFIVIAVVIVLVPGIDIHYHTLRPWQLSTLGLLLLIPWIIVREARAGNVEARTALIGVLVFLAACTNDLMIDLAGWQAIRLVPLGFVAIMLSMAISLANRFTTVLNDLEGQVAQRTTDLMLVNRQLAEIARRDPLTGLLNRRGFSDEAESEIQRFIRNGKEPSFVLADLDKFKEFNDKYGHACGDYVLRQVAHLLSERVRNMDEIGRWGGEEFMLMLPETSSEGATQVAEKLRTIVESQRFEYNNKQLAVTMTFGVATFRKGEALERCIARADTALYEGKEQGRNRVAVSASPGLSLIG